MSFYKEQRFILSSVVFLFTGLSGFAFFFIVSSGPIFFWDSKTYLLVATNIVSGNYDILSNLVEVAIGYPYLLSQSLSKLPDPLFGIILFQAGVNLATDMLIIVIGCLLFRNVLLGFLCGIMSALMVEKIYLSASILTETVFCFFTVLSIVFFLLASEKRKIIYYYASVGALFISGYFRLSSLPLTIVLILLVFGLEIIKNKNKWANILKTAVMLLIIPGLIGYIVLLPLPKSDKDSKFSVLWYRTIAGHDKAREIFKSEYPWMVETMNKWIASREIPEYKNRVNEPFWILPDSPNMVFLDSKWRPIEYRWKEVERQNLKFWKVPIWTLITNGRTYEEAIKWQSRVAQNYLSRFFPMYIKAIFEKDFVKCFSRPIRASFFLEDRQEPFNELYSALVKENDIVVRRNSSLIEISLKFVSCVNIFLKKITGKKVLLAFNFILVGGALLGLCLHRNAGYSYLVVLVLMTIIINVTIAGWLPRYRFLLLPFSGIFLINWFIFTKLVVQKLSFGLIWRKA